MKCSQKMHSLKEWLVDRKKELQQKWSDDPRSCVEMLTVVAAIILVTLGFWRIFMNVAQEMGLEYIVSGVLGYAVSYYCYTYITNFVMWIYDKIAEKHGKNASHEEELPHTSQEELADWLVEHKELLERLNTHMEELGNL